MIDFLAKFILPIFTFALGAWIQSYRTQSSEDIGQLNELIDEIKEARELATEYWSRSTHEDDASLAVKVRSCGHLIFAMAAEANFADRSELDDAVQGFFEAATGGAFETADKAADLGRALEMRIAAADLISIVRRQRRRISSWVFLPAAAVGGIRNWAGTRLTAYQLGRTTKRWTTKFLGGPKS
ncbi:MAG: hypothetical protein JWQ89_1815 [Devosia sp.]|uniref:hypothetical protein n=1 Tax=Devosia sp. TaxID=1871048 RepID=UPI0026081BBF|nr:hypothetical protein [Devosia sp.]MDB5540088.1 hypothetical protein [Devosia sp.]